MVCRIYWTDWPQATCWQIAHLDADWLRDALSQRDIAPVIPPRKNRKHPASYDEEMYKWRHLVENFFQKIKDYRGIETRYCKTDSSFTAFISLAATILWLK